MKRVVYRVKVDNNYALLKLAFDYSIDVYKTLTEEQLALKILVHEILCNNSLTNESESEFVGEFVVHPSDHQNILKLKKVNYCFVFYF